SIGTTTDLERLYQEATAPRRFGMLLLTAFSGVALALTALGLFGLLAQNVRVRRHEIGIRMAIGAWPGSLRNMVLSEAIRLTGKGLTVGILALLFLSGVLSRVLYGVPPHDPVTIAGVVVII